MPLSAAAVTWPRSRQLSFVASFTDGKASRKVRSCFRAYLESSLHPVAAQRSCLGCWTNSSLPFRSWRQDHSYLRVDPLFQRLNFAHLERSRHPTPCVEQSQPERTRHQQAQQPISYNSFSFVFSSVLGCGAAPPAQGPDVEQQRFEVQPSECTFEKTLYGADAFLGSKHFILELRKRIELS